MLKSQKRDYWFSGIHVNALIPTHCHKHHSCIEDKVLVEFTYFALTWILSAMPSSLPTLNFKRYASFWRTQTHPLFINLYPWSCFFSWPFASRRLTEGKLVHLHMKNISFKHPTTLLANHLFPMHLCSSNYVHECCWIMKGARGTVHIEPRTTTQARETSHSYPKP